MTSLVECYMSFNTGSNTCCVRKQYGVTSARKSVLGGGGVRLGYFFVVAKSFIPNVDKRTWVVVMACGVWFTETNRK